MTGLPNLHSALKVVAPNAKESKLEPGSSCFLHIFQSFGRLVNCQVVRSSYASQWTAKGKEDPSKRRGVQSQILEDSYDDDEDVGFVNPVGRYSTQLHLLLISLEFLFPRSLNDS